MKKLISFILSLMLIFTFFVMPSSAQTSPTEWVEGTGDTRVQFSSEGTKIYLDEGISLVYFKEMVNLRDFTIKIKLNTPIYTRAWGYWMLTIGGNGKYFGGKGYQNKVFLYSSNDYHLNLHTEMLHGGTFLFIDPIVSITSFTEDIANNDLIIRGKQFGNQYQIYINDNEGCFLYSIPADYNFVEALNGEGCLGFGGMVHQDLPDVYGKDSFNIVVKEINGVPMTGKEEVVIYKPKTTNNSSTTSSNNVISTNSDNTSNISSTTSGNTNEETNSVVSTEGKNTTTENKIVNNKKNNKKNNKLLLIGIGVFLLILNIVFIVLLLKKNSSKSKNKEISS